MIGDILQPTHLLFVLVVALLVLGPKRLPEVGRSLGRGLRDFRQALSGEEHDEVPTHTGPVEAQPVDRTMPVNDDAPTGDAAPRGPRSPTEQATPVGQLEPEQTTAAQQSASAERNEPAEQPEHVG